ncbi:MAG TPA: hypothetical protein PLS26_07235 [Bacteroidales bacterium]|nr:hypothetical protein [Bacteroidales bacterium]
MSNLSCIIKSIRYIMRENCGPYGEYRKLYGDIFVILIIMNNYE